MGRSGPAYPRILRSRALNQKVWQKEGGRGSASGPRALSKYRLYLQFTLTDWRPAPTTKYTCM